MPDDRTANAKIRDEAMALFAERGVAAVSLREIARSAEVSAPLIIHHFGSKAGLHAAVDTHVADVVSEMLRSLESNGTDTDATSFAALLTAAFEARPHLLDYLRRMLIDGGDTADALFAAVHTATVASLGHLRDVGLVQASDDEELLAAFLLANDLATVLLREPIRAATGVDPLKGVGLERWTAVLMDAYTNGIFTPAEPTDPQDNEEPTT